VLELLAGPFSVLDAESAAVDVTEYPQAIYTDAFGLLTFVSGFGGTMQSVQADGLAYGRSGILANSFFLLDFESGGILEGVGSLPWKLAETGGATGARPAAGASIGPDARVRLKDRYLRVANISGAQRVQWRPLTAYTTDDWTTECTLLGAGAGAPSFSLTRSPRLLVIAYPTGEVLRYDTVALEQVGSALLGPVNGGLWFSAVHGVYIALTGTTTNHVSVYADGPLPTTISDPAGSLAFGTVATITVRVLGDDGDPCVGELVEWSLVGQGYLIDTQSRTNENGYASARYAAPLADSGAGDPTFTATLTI
jgi:hypothetical protein